MFANRFTAVIDACSLASSLKRNLLLSLAEADFFRVRWSRPILDETQRAIARMLLARGVEDAERRAARARAAMERAFEDAEIAGFEALIPICGNLPDPDDAHVVAAALKARADMVVTDNLRHFPAEVLAPLNMEAKSSDAFIADTLSLDPPRGVAAIRAMRARLRQPTVSPDDLMLKMEAEGLTESVLELRDYAHFL